MLLIVFTFDSTYIIKSIGLQLGKGKIEYFDLIQAVILNKEHEMDEVQRNMYHDLKKLRDAAGDPTLGTQLFQEKDYDQSGYIDREELFFLLDSIGMDTTDELVDEIMAQYDVDGAQQINLPEFLAFLKYMHKDAVQRIMDMTESRAMISPQSPDVHYIPPKEGTLHVEMIDGVQKKDSYSKLNGCDENNVKVLVSAVMNLGARDIKLRYNEAMSLYKSMYAEGAPPMNTLAQIALRVDNPADAKRLIFRVTKGEKTGLNMLRNILESSFRPVIGLWNGYYVLDFSKEYDGICFDILLQHNESINASRIAACERILKAANVPTGKDSLKSNLGDTSQYGTWSCFRNVYYNGRPIEVVSSNFRPLPKSGKISFDFSSTARPHSLNDGTVIISDKRLIKILSNLFLLPMDAVPPAIAKLYHLEHELKNGLSNLGKWVNDNIKHKASVSFIFDVL